MKQANEDLDGAAMRPVQPVSANWVIPPGMESISPDTDEEIDGPAEGLHGVLRRCERSGRYYEAVVTFRWIEADAVVDRLIQGLAIEDELGARLREARRQAAAEAVMGW